MSLIVANIADMAISKRKGDIVVTYSLGSCLGLSLYDNQSGVGGILHSMLPDHSIVPDDTNSYKFVNSGIVLFLSLLTKTGAHLSNIVADIAGCSHIMDDAGIFRIGERNLRMADATLSKFSIQMRSKNVGGTKSRTMYLDISTGKLTIDSMGRKLVVP